MCQLTRGTMLATDRQQEGAEPSYDEGGLFLGRIRQDVRKRLRKMEAPGPIPGIDKLQMNARTAVIHTIDQLFLV